MPKLRFRNGPRAGTEFSFERDVVIGRGVMADLSLDDAMVSRRHAMLTWSEGNCYVADLGSENGTYVNNTRISEPTRLNEGDLLNVGTVVMEYVGEPTTEARFSRPSPVRVAESRSQSSRVLMTMATGDHGIDTFDENQGKDLLLTVSRRVRFLNALSKAVAEASDEDALLSFVLDELFELIPRAERAFVMFWDSDTKSLVPKIGRTRTGGPSEIVASQTLLNDVVRRREGILVVESLADERYREAMSMRALGIRSAICVPIISHDRFYGVIQVDCASVAQAFGKSDMALMLGVASQVGLFLGYADLHRQAKERELLERDMMLARKIQRHFVRSRPPTISGYGFAVEFAPALEVGGDFYDFLAFAGGRFGVVVGDASGKGISAALYAAQVSGDLRYHSVAESSPAAVLQRVNRSLATTGGMEGMFATVVLLVVEPNSGEVTVVSAGHPLPLLRRGEEEVAPLGRHGDPPLGLDEAASFGEHRYQLADGDIVVLYTDGVTEAEGEGGELFGEGRLRRAIARSSGIGEVTRTVLSEIKQFVGGAAQSDDVTLLCLRRAGR